MIICSVARVTRISSKRLATKLSRAMLYKREVSKPGCVALTVKALYETATPKADSPTLELVREKRSRSFTTASARVLLKSNVAFCAVGSTVIVEFVTDTVTLNIVGWKATEQKLLPSPAYQSPLVNVTNKWSVDVKQLEQVAQTKNG